MATISKTIILFGLKSSFKSSHGQQLAKHFELPFYDTDYVIQKMAGISPQEIYVNQGVSAFMQAEEAACKKIVEVTKDKNAIISTGGDICCNPPALNALRSKGDFYLIKTNPQSSVDMIMKMVHEPQPGFFTNIPFYIVGKNPESLDEIAKILLDIFSERLRTYEAIADKIIEIKNASQADDYNTILEAL
ncbi:MAG: hypothetical protein J5527_14335 [Treponema sp.]|nr:hypothetical protein [Treponema sp.]